MDIFWDLLDSAYSPALLAKSEDLLKDTAAATEDDYITAATARTP